MSEVDPKQALNVMVRSFYDLQQLRMQIGLRLTTSFRAKLGYDDAGKHGKAGEHVGDDGDEQEAEKLLKQLVESYRRLTDGVAKNRTLPAEKGFKGDGRISTHAELTLVHQYVAMSAEEDKQSRMLERLLERFAIWNMYLRQQRGVGPAMGAILVVWFDPAKAYYPSSYWRFAGLDVGPDGRGRSRRREHLIERTYVDRNGETKTKWSTTYNPFVKTKVVGVMANVFLRVGSPWREEYDFYKHRINSDPKRVKCTINEYKLRLRNKEDVTNLWPPGRIDHAAKRYMIKWFLVDYWRAGRRLANLSIEPAYAQGVLHMAPHHSGARFRIDPNDLHC